MALSDWQAKLAGRCKMQMGVTGADMMHQEGAAQACSCICADSLVSSKEGNK